MLQLVLFFAVAFVTSWFWLQSRKENPKKILGIYSQPGKWYILKYYSFRILLKFKQLMTVERRNAAHYREMESLQELSQHEEAVDAVFFQAVNSDGYYLATGTERRHEGRIVGLFYLAVPEYGLLLSPKLPSTKLTADSQTLYTKKEYSAEGIRLAIVKPMEMWTVEYKGKMRSQKDPQKWYDVSFEGQWTAYSPHFNFDTEMSRSLLAKAIAKEEWTREYFETLKNAHQAHYEQMGLMDVKLRIDNETSVFKMDAFRDHSFAYKRDWSLMHRYIFHMLYLNNGFRASLGVVCQPCTGSHLEMGFVVVPDRKNYPITGCDIVLYQHGEDGTPPMKFAFSFVANDVTYNVSLEVEYQNEHFVGTHSQARMVERFFKCVCNEVEGRGISEWNYSTACKDMKR